MTNERGLEPQRSQEVVALSHLWSSGARDRHARLEAAFRPLLKAHDSAGCHGLLDAVAEAGGAEDPLVVLFRGMTASQVDRDWGTAESSFHAVLGHEGLSASVQARTWRELGLLEFYQGRYAAALKHYKASSRLAEAAGDELVLAGVLMNQGIACTEGWIHGDLPQAALDEALACHTWSKDIFHAHGEPELELRVWNNMGAVYKSLGRLDEAAAAYRAALALTPPTHRFVRAILTNNMAEVEDLQGHWAEAYRAYEEALSIYRELDDDYEIADALLNLGSIEERRGQTDRAMARYREAISAIESTRARLKSEEARAGFLGTRLAAYERLVRLALDIPGQESLLFEIVERAKARAFVELLAGRPLRAPRAVPDHLLEREEKLRSALSHLYAVGGRADALGTLARRTAAMETELEEIYRQVRRLDAQYADFRTVDPVPLAQVQERLPHGSVILEYFEARGELGCLVISQTSAIARLLPGASEVVHRYLATRKGISDPVSLLTASELWNFDELYSSLIGPIEAFLQGHCDLYLVPHGPLHYIALHALGGKSTLLEQYRVTYAPSASALLLGESGTNDMEEKETVLALGYNDASLHYAAREAQHIATFTGGRLCTGSDATSEVLFHEGAAYRVVHLACHGTFTPHAPLASGLLLADGKLDAMSILRELRLNADLVVLSACDTGHAAVLRGDELMGLARAFLYAGARTVLVSLWPVDDLATALLMDAFYRALALLPPKPESAAEALRQAQLILRSLSREGAITAAERLNVSAGAEVSGAVSEIMPVAAPRSSHVSPRPSGSGRIESGGDAPPLPLPVLPLREPDADNPYAHPYYWAAFVLICQHM